MSYYTTDVYEIKREITIFSSKISKNLKGYEQLRARYAVWNSQENFCAYYRNS